MIDPMLPDDGHPAVTSRVLRQFAGLWIAFFAILAYWKGYLHEDDSWLTICGSLAIVPGMLGLVFPPAIRPVFVALTVLTYPIGLVVSNVLLGLMYYGILTPVGLLFRLIGRDVLERHFPGNDDTYWSPKPQAADVRSYFRQS